MIGQAYFYQGLYYLHDFHPNSKKNTFSVNIICNCKDSSVDI